ncbi:phytanoyl-CoA dioxygenase family protein [uncultured Sphingomonas sp.]|uniref:phytanoyl-CoA dioxygenase family protein n=1 Tax=uncultured Sphingomonas sp. TaxID=158754 RepID=UPI0035CAD3E0
MDGADLSFEEHGAARHDRAAFSVLDEIERVLAGCPRDRAGTRLHGIPGLNELLSTDGAVGRIAAGHLGAAAHPVRALLFDKTPGANWSLGWHQDRTIAVRERHDVPGFGPWSIKAGIQHVEPSFDVIEAMVTLRIHLDSVPADNAPLLIAPGSHRLGRIAEPDISTIVGRCGTAVCLAERGDVWSYATSILHASAASAGYAHRRVLQIDYAAGALTKPLRWLGV